MGNKLGESWYISWTVVIKKNSHLVFIPNLTNFTEGLKQSVTSFQAASSIKVFIQNSKTVKKPSRIQVIYLLILSYLRKIHKINTLYLISIIHGSLPRRAFVLPSSLATNRSQ